MVLEEATSSTPSSDYPSDSTPSSDLDPYAGSNPDYSETRPSTYLRATDTNPPLYVNAADLPQPVFSRPGDPRITQSQENVLRQSAANCAQRAGRPVTQQEAEALAYHQAVAVRTASFGLPLGIALGVLQFGRGMRTFRFPFWQVFKKGGRLSPDRFGPLRGTQARIVWHSLRAFAYSIVYQPVGSLLAGVYAIQTDFAARNQDSRLKDLYETIQKSPQGRSQSLEAARQQRQSMEQTQQANQRGESMDMWKMRRQAEADAAAKRQRPSTVDDMSPTSGAFEEELKMQSDGFVKDDWQAPQDGQSWQGSSTSPDAASTPSTPQQPRTSSQRPTNTSPQSSSPMNQTGSGSAWERLRQNAMSGGDQSSSSPASRSSKPSPGSTSQSSDSDSFSFSQGYEDKQLARSEAQKEFDARIEREREGMDFDDSSGKKGKRW